MLKQFMSLIDDMGAMKVKTEGDGWVMPDDAGSETTSYGGSLYELFFERMADEVRAFAELIDIENPVAGSDDTVLSYAEYYIETKRKDHAEVGMNVTVVEERLQGDDQD
jgi:hypothetical protein